MSDNTMSGSNRILSNVDRDMESQRRRRNERTRHERARNNINPRDRLFHALFIKIGHVYSRLVPKKFRVLLEVVVLLKGLLLFTFLSYLHFSFGRVPMNCLNTTKDSWPRDGILRVQIQSEFGLRKQIPRFYSSEQNTVLFHPCHYDASSNIHSCNAMPADIKAFFQYKSRKYMFKNQCYRMNLSDFMFHRNHNKWKLYQDFEYVITDKSGRLFKGFNPGEIISEGQLLAFYEKYLASNEPERHYIFEYAQEFGFLRLSPEIRSKLRIPIKTITLDPKKEKCFGDSFSRFLLKYILGYDDVLMNSIKKIADAENNTGYMLNVVTGDHYKFVSWGIGRGSYFISLMLMFLFTISISTLLRYCHQQVFFFIIHVLQMMDMNVVLAFPIAPLFTVILSLVGMETIMSEYFNDTTTSFYIILIVWAVDQFDTICCHTVISQKYWLRFFYLYHFIFYAYHYRFNGQYSSLALAATWFLIQHSMLYFFHNYELPAIENNLHNGRWDEEAYLDEAVQMIVEGIEMVAGQQPATPRQENRPNENVENGNAANENADVNQPENNENNVNPTPEANNRIREISTGANGANRIFIFAADRPFIHMVREFIRQVHEGMNSPTPHDPANPVDETPGDSIQNEIAGDASDSNELDENINNDTAVDEVHEAIEDNTLRTTGVASNETSSEEARRTIYCNSDWLNPDSMHNDWHELHTNQELNGNENEANKEEMDVAASKATDEIIFCKDSMQMSNNDGERDQVIGEEAPNLTRNFVIGEQSSSATNESET